jgi:hypothetical protein
MSKEQVYYEFLTRTDHPVFLRDFSTETTVSSPLNSILNRIVARQFVILKERMDELRANSYPATVTALTINDWEFEYFGFTKPGLTLAQRVAELVIKVNKRFHLNVQDVIDLSLSIVGIKPIVTRNMARDGWQLGRGVLGISTSFGGDANVIGLYLVYFPHAVDSGLLAKLDERLTKIEKAGSVHRIKASIPRWILGRAVFGRDTTLGA